MKSIHSIAILLGTVLTLFSVAAFAAPVYQIHNVADELGPRGFGCFRTAHPDDGGVNYSCDHGGAALFATVSAENVLTVYGHVAEVLPGNVISDTLTKFWYEARGITMAAGGTSFFDATCEGRGLLGNTPLGNKANAQGWCVRHGVNSIPNEPTAFGIEFWTGGAPGTHGGDVWGRTTPYIATVPLPATGAMMVVALAVVGAARRRRRK